MMSIPRMNLQVPKDGKDHDWLANTDIAQTEKTCLRWTSVRSRTNEKMLDECSMPSAQHGGGNVMVWVLKWQICRKAVTPFCNTVPCGRRVMWSHIFPTTGRRPRAQLQMSEEEVRSYSVYKPGLNPGEMLWEQLDCVVHSKCPSNRFDLR